MNMTSFNPKHRAMHGVALCAMVLPMVLFFPRLVGAADLDINPVRLEISAQEPTAAITIKNESDKPTSIQIRAVAWSQLDGKDVYVPTGDLLVSPPIVTIAPKSEQVIRAALRRPVDKASELAYRINLQELPEPPDPAFAGVQVALRIGLPVFVQPQESKALPKMAWSIVRLPDNTLKVGLHNSGNAHVQISDFALYVPGSAQPLVGESSSSYVLAGQTREWLLKPVAAMDKANGGLLRLKAYTDAGDIDMELALAKP